MIINTGSVFISDEAKFKVLLVIPKLKKKIGGVNTRDYWKHMTIGNTR